MIYNSQNTFSLPTTHVVLTNQPRTKQPTIMRYTSTILLGLAICGLASAHPTEPELTDIEAQYGVTQTYHDTSALAARSVGADYPTDETELLKRDYKNIPVVPITWIGAVHPGGPNISITGSHTFVRSKLGELGAHWYNNTTLNTHKAALQSRGLDKRVSTPILSFPIMQSC